jgi:hypothetical protein
VKGSVKGSNTPGERPAGRVLVPVRDEAAPADEHQGLGGVRVPQPARDHERIATAL